MGGRKSRECTPGGGERNAYGPRCDCPANERGRRSRRRRHFSFNCLFALAEAEWCVAEEELAAWRVEGDDAVLAVGEGVTLADGVHGRSDLHASLRVAVRVARDVEQRDGLTGRRL